jgi:hypothetical protein
MVELQILWSLKQRGTQSEECGGRLYESVFGVTKWGKILWFRKTMKAA